MALTHHVVQTELMFLIHPAVLPVTRMHQRVQWALTHHVDLMDLVRLAVQLAKPLHHMVLMGHTAHTVLRLTVVLTAQFLTALVVQLVTENEWTSNNNC